MGKALADPRKALTDYFNPPPKDHTLTNVDRNWPEILIFNHPW